MFDISVITININPVAFSIGSLAVHWYGIMYAIAFVMGYRFGVLPHLRNRGVSKAQVERMLTATIIVGLLGARLYYVVQQPDLVSDYLEHPINIIAVWQGGMAFFGAIMGAALTLLYFARREHVSFWLLLDAGAFFAAVGQPIGRIGNVINGDILGGPSTAWFATAYTYPTGVGHCAVLQPGFQCGVGYQPAAVYEALGTIAILVILLAMRRRGVSVGVVGISYLALYSISQFLVFFLRQSEPVIGLGLKQAQWTALVQLFIAVPIIYVIWRKTRNLGVRTAGDGGSGDGPEPGGAADTPKPPAESDADPVERAG